ncbi:sulfatase family protein [Rhodopirellula sallentina]|uniref:Heparan N-sulfatase n=1 Tax=Rhodopirellula sallentina SM41 TaxID=1263870 RepID=M5UL29_9BACT|nr:sulfatase [Rhodopirellula sallentina]EMI56698.1 heparan N-sulfatase [Rhodopirellula sallentina SM41]
MSQPAERFWIFTIAVFAITLGSYPSLAEDRPQQPNVVLFVSDDHGLDALGCYGNPVIQTPNMDQLAEDGVRFTRAYCTSASCAASRSVILTGQFGHATGSYGHVHDYHHFSTFDNVKSLPVMLEKAGYRTTRIGKYHLAPDSVYRFQKTLDVDPRSTVEMADACQQTIASDQPFFLYFCPDDPHRGHPFTPAVWSDPNSFGNRPEGYPGVKTVTYQPDEVLVPPFLPDTEQCREELAQYYQSVSRIDQGLGRLMKLIDEAGKSENTIIIYLSDNGIAFPGAKTTVYEPGIHLPLIVKDPRSEKTGSVNHAMVTWADLTPTILEMTGTAVDPNRFQGHSFAGILDQSSPEGWDRMFAAHNFHELTMYYPMRVIRQGDHKLIWNIAYGLSYPFASDLWASSTWQGIHRTEATHFGKRLVSAYLFRPEFELYDLSSDPDELKNLASDPKHADLLEKLKGELKEFQIETKDPWQIQWNNESQVQGTGVGL